jgi:hypothetical protein
MIFVQKAPIVICQVIKPQDDTRFRKRGRPVREGVPVLELRAEKNLKADDTKTGIKWFLRTINRAPSSLREPVVIRPAGLRGLFCTYVFEYLFPVNIPEFLL